MNPVLRQVGLVSLFVLIFTSFSYSQERKKVPFLTPPQAIKKMTMPEGFSVKAFAAEPNVSQPFAFCFDSRGRVWVAENLNYLTRGSDSFNDGPKGRIAILEDTDGDGIFDKRKVFIDKIFFPSGLAVGFDGVWVGSPPNLLFIPDANQDDKPDGKPEIVLDGWGRHDRHETLNSFTWGPDGWLYGCHGVFTHSNVGKPGAPDSERHRINAGVWRYHPTKEKFEVFAWGTSNPWGLDFNEKGQVFITACVIPHLWHMIQGGRYHRQAGRHFNPYVYDDIKTIAIHRNKSAHGGARFYLADKFPKRYHKKIFMCNIHQHDILAEKTERKGSGYVGMPEQHFLQSNDPQWLGFNMELGPDGAIYVIDWHDQDICGRKVHHEETGRIWRVAYKGTRGVLGLNLDKKSDDELINEQKNPNYWHRRTAQRILQKRASQGKLKDGTRNNLWAKFNSETNSDDKLCYLWCLYVTESLKETQLLDLIKNNNSDEYVKAWCIQFLCEDKAPSKDAIELFTQLAKEGSSAFVRLYLASACQRMPVESRWGILEGLVQHAEDKDDHNLPLMLWYALEPTVPVDGKRALAIARKGKIPLLVRYTAQRIAAEALKKKNKPKSAKPAKSVSSDGLALWLRADWGVQQSEGKVSKWLDRSDDSRDALQKDAGSRPQVVENLGGRKALKFDGQNDYLSIPHDEKIAFKENDSYTVSTWVYFSNRQGGWRSIIAKSRDQSPWYGIWVEPEGNWVFGGSGKNLEGLEAKRGWHHISIVQTKKGERFFYVDGLLVKTSKAVQSNGKGDLWIAGAKSTQEFFNGGISEVRIYRRALNHPEVAHLAKNP